MPLFRGGGLCPPPCVEVELDKEQQQQAEDCALLGSRFVLDKHGNVVEAWLRDLNEHLELIHWGRGLFFLGVAWPENVLDVLFHTPARPRAPSEVDETKFMMANWLEVARVKPGPWQRHCATTVGSCCWIKAP